MTVFAEEVFTFYEGLSADNSKTFWNAHKDVYEKAIREPMRELLEGLAPAFAADVVIFRPYRDVRFSKDKSPYKTAQGGFLELAPGVGYYLQIDAEGVLVGGGFHAHGREQTNRFRAAVDAEPTGSALETITAKLVKAGFVVGGEQVRTRPRGVAPDHPRLDLMRREYLTVGRQLPPEQVTPTTVGKHWRSLKPLVMWVLDNAPPD
nr:DUF2461 domain-containing protein [Rhizocola hellebori]